MDWGPEDLRDGYLYGDFCSGSIWILKEENGGWMQNYVGSSGGMIVGFGQGLNDELLAFHWTGEIGFWLFPRRGNWSENPSWSIKIGYC